MTPQSAFTVVAPIRSGRIAALRDLLRGMTAAPGQAAPENALIPFGRFARLHFARLVVLDVVVTDAKGNAVQGLKREAEHRPARELGLH